MTLNKLESNPLKGKQIIYCCAKWSLKIMIYKAALKFLVLVINFEFLTKKTLLFAGNLKSMHIFSFK
jgi:hypothetical protein